MVEILKCFICGAKITYPEGAFPGTYIEFLGGEYICSDCLKNFELCIVFKKHAIWKKVWLPKNPKFRENVVSVSELRTWALIENQRRKRALLHEDIQKGKNEYYEKNSSCKCFSCVRKNNVF